MQISDYLKKFQSLGLLNTQTKNTVSEVLTEFFSQEISKMCSIEIKKKTIKIKAPSVVRSEILFQKEKILEKINEKMDGKIIFFEIV